MSKISIAKTFAVKYLTPGLSPGKLLSGHKNKKGTPTRLVL